MQIQKNPITYSRVIKPRREEFSLPDSFEPYTDVYFLRSKKILEEEKKNSQVTMQVFIRDGPGIVCGIDEAIAIIKKYSELEKHGGKIYALYDGQEYQPKETIMLIEGPLQDIIGLETMYLSAISAGTTYATNMNKIVRAAEGKPVYDFGARHFHYSIIPSASYATWVGGAEGCSTEIGAREFGEEPVGTIPHALILAFGDTVETAKAYIKHISDRVIVLIDTFNKEITDALRVVKELGENVIGVRIDTCGENIPEGCSLEKGGYEDGYGVTIQIGRKLREELDKNGYKKVKIILSSGFDENKTRAFREAEKIYGEFFDAIGTGSYLSPVYYATADVVIKDGKEYAKVGRGYSANERLELVG